jgi:hypothetical protein
MREKCFDGITEESLAKFDCESHHFSLFSARIEMICEVGINGYNIFREKSLYAM